MPVYGPRHLLMTPQVLTAQHRHPITIITTLMKRNTAFFCRPESDIDRGQRILLLRNENERKLQCPECGNEVFPRINPAVIVAVSHGDELILTKYAGREYKKYALIAGFAEFGETIEQTVQREVMEEVGIRVKNLRYYKSQPWGFSGSLLFGFFAEAEGDLTIYRQEDELAEAMWVPAEEIVLDIEEISLTREMMQVFQKEHCKKE